MSKLIGIAFAAAVALAAVFAFSPRTLPTFPQTGLRVDTVLLLDAARAGTRIVVVGERGRILVSDDEGMTWRGLKSPTEATLTALFFHDAKRGWAVGHDAVILRTEDGAETWQQVFAAPDQERPLLGVWFRNAQEGLAIGAYGAFLETQDGGRNWSERKITEGDRHLNAFAAIGDNYFIAGESGTLLSSANSGGIWEPLVSPYQGSFFGILADPKNVLLAFGLRGNVFYSEDLGRTWIGVDNPSQASIMGGTVIAPGKILVGHAGTVLRSDDGGKTFSLHQGPGGRAFAAALQTASGDLLALGERGVARIPGFLKP